MTQVTEILSQIETGDSGAAAQLLPLVYEELRKLAAARLANEQPGQTLQPTALVHEAYLRLVDGEHVQDWNSRGHFFGAAAEAMRRILVEKARRRATTKHGREFNRLQLDEQAVAGRECSTDLLALDEVLSRLESHSPQAAEIVKLRYFAGLSHQEAAESMNISRRVADRLWTLAKTWLYTQLSET